MTKEYITPKYDIPKNQRVKESKGIPGKMKRGYYNEQDRNGEN